MPGRWFRFAVLLLGLLTWHGAVAEPQRLQVAVSVPPQAYFVERIAGDLASVSVMMPPGSSHDTYAPPPRQRVRLSEAEIYVKVGHPAFTFEAKHIDPFLRDHPQIRVIDMAQGVRFRPMEAHGHEHNSEDAEHDAGDPHVWLAPSAVATVARNIAQALTQADPDHATSYQANLESFLTDIRQLDAAIRQRLAGLKQRKFMVYHPAWGYFADEYGLEQIAIEHLGSAPSPQRIMELVKQARRENVTTIFVQHGFSRKSAEIIAREIRGKVVEMDPLARDWLSNMQQAAQVFGSVLSDE